jgi:hypothetical protein
VSYGEQFLKRLVEQDVKQGPTPSEGHQLNGRISGASGIASFCSCGLAFYGRDVSEADTRFDGHVR